MLRLPRARQQARPSRRDVEWSCRSRIGSPGFFPDACRTFGPCGSRRPVWHRAAPSAVLGVVQMLLGSRILFHRSCSSQIELLYRRAIRKFNLDGSIRLARGKKFNFETFLANGSISQGRHSGTLRCERKHSSGHAQDIPCANQNATPHKRQTPPPSTRGPRYLRYPRVRLIAGNSQATVQITPMAPIPAPT